MKSPLPSANTLFEWIGAGDQNRVIATVKNIPEPQRSPDVNCAYYAAIVTNLDVPTPTRMADLRDAIEKMRSLLKDLSPRNPFHARLAGIYYNMLAHANYQLGEFKDAAQYFKKAPDIPGNGFNRQIIRTCRTAMERPKDRESFRSRTQKAWAAILPEEADLRKMMNDAINSPKIWNKMCTRVNSLLKIAFQNVEWSWYEGDVPMLRLSPSRSKCVALAQQYFFAHAPEGLSERWDFNVGIRVPDDEDLEVMRGEPQWLCDMEVQVRPAANDMLRAELYHPSLDMENESGKAIKNIFEALNQNLGELVFLSLFSKISISSDPLDGHTIKLGYLLPTLEAMGYCTREDIPSLVRRRHPYTRIPESHKPGDDYRWRDDIVRGATMDPTICSSFTNDKSEDDAAKYLAGSGAVPCFVVFPSKGQTDNPPALMQTLLNELDDALDEDIGIALGEAEGLQFGYLDLLAFDLQPALDTAANVLRKHNIPWACWHSFFTTDRTLQIY